MLSMALTQPQDGGPSGLGVPTLEHRHEGRALVGWQGRAASDRRSRVRGHGRAGRAGTAAGKRGVTGWATPPVRAVGRACKKPQKR